MRGSEAKIDEYRIVRPLGRPEHASFLAHDRKLDRPVVLHLLPAAPEARRAVLASARALARVTHPSLCRVHRIREGGVAPCVVQSFVRGERLPTLPGPFAPHRVRALGTALAGALTALHAARVVHGDVRADRIVISPSGVPCLIGLHAARPDAGPEAIAADVRALAAALAEIADGHVRASLLRVAGGGLTSAEELRRALEPGTPKGADEGEPYRGLQCFEAEHAGLFFGRDEDIDAAIERLRDEPWLLVTAPSGAGKSSLVRAGLVPAITGGALGERARWDVATCTPGPRPLAALAQALAPVLGGDPAAFEEALRTDPSLAGDWARARPPDEGGLLLVVDQLEETMTLAGTAERDAFLAVLAGFGALAPGVRALMTLRSDFLDRLGTIDAPLARRLLRAAYVLPAMGADALRLAIAGPAHARGFEMETPGMVEQLVAEGQAHAEGESLPLLSFLLAELWAARDRERRVLPAAALARLGGAVSVLARHGDTVLSALSPDERQEARRILLALVTAGGTRARKTREELSAEGTGPAHRALEALIRGRIVVAGDGYEIAHETLVRAWPRLRGWLDEASDERAAARRLTEAAAEWERLGRDPGLLWGARQAQDLELLGALGGASETARAFAAASRAAIRRAQRLVLGLALGVPIALAAAGAGAWGFSYARRRTAVAEALTHARALQAKADERAHAADETRARAFAAFERDDLEPAEQIWKEALAQEEDTDQARREVGEAVARALALDPRDATARALAADVTLARLLAAERLHEKTLFAALRAELDVYDDGSRAAWLTAPGHVTAETDPPAATLTLARYREDDAGKLVETPAGPIAPGERRALEPGSYLVAAEARGRYPTRHPFVVHRGEEIALRVVLPRAEDVPEGMVYVPAGRMIYGNADDEATRVFLVAQPGHDVEVGAFLIARTEVTNAEYLAFLSTLPEPERRQRLPAGLSAMEDGRIGVKLHGRFLTPGEPYCDGPAPCVDWSRLPATGMNREDAERFAAYLARKKRPPGARLCTDREWERAARGADERLFPSGNTEPGPMDACVLATYGGDLQRAGPCVPGTHPASQSPFGVDDMTGSAWEWTSGTADAAHPAQGIVRGGDCRSFGLYLAIPNRRLLGSGLRDENYYGLRLCAGVR